MDPGVRRLSLLGPARASVPRIPQPSGGVIEVVGDTGSRLWTMRQQLDAEGFVLEAFGTSSLSSAAPEPFGRLIVVDGSLPRAGFVGVVEGLRSQVSSPILVMCDLRDEELVLTAFEVGADQVVSTEASSRTLIATIRSLLRRPVVMNGVDRNSESESGIHFDDVSSGVVIDGVTHQLREHDYRVLRILVQATGRVVNRRHLVSREVAEARALRELELTIRRLRQCLRTHPGHGRIEVVRSVGFRFVRGHEMVISGAEDVRRADGSGS